MGAAGARLRGRVPRHPARGPRRGGVRRRADGGGDRAGRGLHAVRGPGAPRRRAEGAQPALRRRAGGPGSLSRLDLLAAPDPQHDAAHRRPGHHLVRLRHGRPGCYLLPRPRGTAARAELGRHDLGEPGGYPAGLPAARPGRLCVHRCGRDRRQRAGGAALRASPADAPMNGPLLEVDGLTVLLDVEGARRAVLSDISFAIRPGEAVGLVGIEDGAQRLRQYPHQMSGGILQRIMIAAALLTEPRLLLADEPTTALDVTTQAEVMAILDGLRRDFGLAMLFITHDLELAGAICDRTVVMYAGQIVEVRASGLLHGDPLHPYTAALAAARPDIAQTAHRLRAIPGRPLSAFEAPRSECAFAPRCPHARDICRADVPALAGLDGGLSRCARAYELRGQLQEVPRA